MIKSLLKQPAISSVVTNAGIIC